MESLNPFRLRRERSLLLSLQALLLLVLSCVFSDQNPYAKNLCAILLVARRTAQVDEQNGYLRVGGLMDDSFLAERQVCLSPSVLHAKNRERRLII